MEKKYLAIVIICLGWMVSFPTAIYLYQIMNRPVFDGPFSRQFNIASVSYSGISGGAPNYINMTIQNTGVVPWTLTNTAQVNAVTGLAVTDLSVKNCNAYNCTNGNSIRISVTMSPSWVSGNQYSITLLTTDGTKITHVSSAP
jgi:hypothetical protein